MAIKKIGFENFTVFEKMDIELSGGINIFTGGNGTGKTHLLKVLYAFCESEMRKDVSHDNIDLLSKLFKCFHVGSSNVSFLIRNDCNKAEITVSTNNDEHKFVIKNGIIKNEEQEVPIFVTNVFNVENKDAVPSVFIPAKEMLTHSGLEKDYTQRKLPFDITLIDILNKSGVSILNNLPDNMRSLLKKIENIVGGKVLFENNRYYIIKSNGKMIDFAVEAEGFKKLGLIYRLIETGNITKGSILIWDEPESNINPQNIPVIVEILLELQKIGLQIFVATHDYFLAKYFNVKKTTENDVLFHALFKSGETILHESDADFTMLENNSIVKQSIELYKEEVKKVME
jgi:predicted ATP-dependent endonuclease of OLD family